MLRFFTLLFILFLPTAVLLGQSITVYNFTSENTASLSSMGSGTNLLIGANKTNTPSNVAPIGFDFIFMGKVYSTFSVNANGVLRFGNEPVLAEANTYGIPGNDRIAAFAVAGAQELRSFWFGSFWVNSTADLATHTNGKVHYKVFGNAPNRYLVIEWKNMQIPAGSGSADGTFQLRLFESAPGSNAKAGTIELVYGAMTVGNNRQVDYRVGFGVGPESGNFYSIDVANGLLSETNNYTNSAGSGNIGVLNSSSGNSRRVYRFVADRRPTGNFSDFEMLCPAPNSVSIKFTETAADEAGIAVFRKEKGEADNKFRLVKSLLADARILSDGGTEPGKQYVYRFFFLGESLFGLSHQDYETAPIPASTGFQTVNSGNWTNAETWGGAVPGNGQNVTIGCSGTVFITADGSARVNNLTIEQGSFLTLADGQTLEISGDFINNGVFNPQGSAKVVFTGGNDQLIINNGLGKTNDTRFVSSSSSTTWANDVVGKVAEKQISVTTTDFLAVKEVLVDISHTYLRDLTLYLRAPNGDRFKLAENRGQRGADYDRVTFTDLGLPLPPSITNTNLTGSYRPEESFSNYKGSIQGTWTLEVEDRMVGVGGTLNDFELVLTKGGSNDLVLRNMEVDKTGGKLTLNSGISLEGALNLQNGIIYTDDVQLITFENGASSNEGSATSFIDGPAIKRGNQDFVFPIGKNGKWAPLGINNLRNSSATTAFKASYHDAPHAEAGNVGSELVAVSKLEYWDLTPLVGSPRVNVTLFWKNNPEKYITDITSSELVVAHYTGGSWVDEGGTVVAGSSAAVGGQGGLTAYDINTFSPFTFGTTGYNNPLPVELLSFSGYSTEAANVLRWVTLTERNNSHFVLERSEDGLDFVAVATLPGNGTTTDRHQYEYTDANVPYSPAYYRLKQVDYDGTEAYFKIIRVDGQISKGSLRVYPNPVNAADGNLTLDFAGLQLDEASLELLSLTGKRLAEYTWNRQENLPRLTISVSDFPKGTYLVRLSGNDQVWVKKIIVQ